MVIVNGRFGRACDSDVEEATAQIHGTGTTSGANFTTTTAVLQLMIVQPRDYLIVGGILRLPVEDVYEISCNDSIGLFTTQCQHKFSQLLLPSLT